MRRGSNGNVGIEGMSFLVGFLVAARARSDNIVRVGRGRRDLWGGDGCNFLLRIVLTWGTDDRYWLFLVVRMVAKIRFFIFMCRFFRFQGFKKRRGFRWCGRLDGCN